jgi:heme/copper-type cytochrome/quinol oxidase subunit 3
MLRDLALFVCLCVCVLWLFTRFLMQDLALFVCLFVCFAVVHSIPNAYQISLCRFYLVDFNELFFSSCDIM